MMGKGAAMAEIDYFFTPISPFVYLAGTRMEDVARKHGATVNYKPMALGKVFEKGGTLPLSERPDSRKRYRLQELARVAAFNGMKINSQPMYWPANPVPASAAIILAQREGHDDVGSLAHAFARACWAEETDIADDEVVKSIAVAHGVEAGLLDRGMLDAVEIFERNTQEAINRHVFGAPSYLVGEEVFWGQDRIAYLDVHLAG